MPLPIDRWKRLSHKTLEDLLSSAVLAEDNELDHILREVDRISNAMHSGAPDALTLNSVLLRAVSCAGKERLLERELRALALTDDLTGLYNRRGFLASAVQQLKIARRSAQGLSLFFCDVDNLKVINDSHGHSAGDLALIRTADALENTFRDSDILARLGGDEFAVLALEGPNQHHDVILPRLWKNLKKATANESRYALSVSVGVAQFDPRRPVTIGELMARADRAMYEEKRRTRESAIDLPVGWLAQGWPTFTAAERG